MAGEWCVVLDAVSPKAARKLGDVLGGEGLDVELDARNARVWCFASDRPIDDLVAAVGAILGARGLSESLQLEPQVRVWSETFRRYVDPASPGEDPDSTSLWIPSEVEPDEIRWLVRLELAGPAALRGLRRQLPPLRRPVIGTGRKHIDLGARHDPDVDRLAEAARTFPGVVAVRPRELRNEVHRWLVRRRLAGSWVEREDGTGYDYPEFGGGDTRAGR